MSEAKHTQGKMVICISGTENDPSYALSANGFIIFQTVGGNDKNNAYRLCLCWNNHDALVEALGAWIEVNKTSEVGERCKRKAKADKLTEQILAQIEKEQGNGNS